MGKTFQIDPNLPKSPFDGRSTAEDVTEGLELKGKGTGRTAEKAKAACAKVAGQTSPMVLESTDFASVVQCADAITALGLPIDMLICNAGTSTFGKQKLHHGIEEMFVINYLSHFILVNRLLPLVEAADSGRIVHVSSRASPSSRPGENEHSAAYPILSKSIV